jgi:D-cysteine desulfhydrase family pyridoxal phosphate-dependent enzyme
MSDLVSGAIDSLRQKLGEFARVELVGAETPFDRLRHLGSDLGIDLWLKRDDLTPLAFGGDKPRKLEFELGRAMSDGADVIVTCGSSQSNHARLTTAAARRLGLDAIVVLSRDEHTEFQGNLLTVRLMGAGVTIVDAADHWDLETDALDVCERLRSEGRSPHYVPVSGTTPLSCLGYVVGALELAEQMESRGVEPDSLYLPFGTGGIFTATLLTLRVLGIQARVVGISVNRDTDACEEFLDRWWGELCGLLQIDDSIDRGDHALYDDYVGREYGDATPDGLDAIVAMASTEGVLLDPVYSGKVFAGLRGHRRDGLIPDGATVVMLHSGGTPALFAYHKELARHLGIEE